MNVTEVIKRLKVNLPSSIFQLIISELVSSHVNSSKKVLLGQVSFKFLIVFFMRNIFFSLFFLRRFFNFSNENVFDQSTSKFTRSIIYCSNNKTKTESEFLEKFFLNKMNESISIYDKADGNLFYIDLFPLVNRFIIPYLKSYFSIVYFMLIAVLSKKINFREFIFLSLALKNLAVNFKWKSILFYTQPKLVLNFFSATTEGHSLNLQAKLLDVPVYTYSWGSNVKALEQVYTIQDYTLLKSESELGKYRNGKQLVLGDIGLKKVNRVSGCGSIIYDICLIDTCYNDSFGLHEKISFYKRLFSWFDVIGVGSVHLVFHPGSDDFEHIFDLSEQFLFKFSVSISDLDLILTRSNLVVNVVSTELKTVINSMIPVVNLAPLFFTLYLKDTVCEGFLSTSSGLDITEWNQLFQFSDIQSVINTGFEIKKYRDFIKDYRIRSEILDKLGESIS